MSGSDVVTSTIKMVLNATTKCTKHLSKAKSDSVMDHSNHDAHSSHSVSSHNLHDGMVMSFHGGYNEIILFDFWKTDSVSIFIVSCIILFVFAALYEGLKLVREKLIRSEIVRRQDLLRGNPTISTCHCDHKNNAEHKNLLDSNNHNNNNNNTTNTNDDVLILDAQNHNCCQKNKNVSNDNKTIVFKDYSSRLFSFGHLIQTLMHMLQITLSYLLMLVFMTYNSWLCLSVVLGAGLGYFLFGLKRLTTIDVNEHCH